MVRYEENMGNNIRIAYGHTEPNGIFLSVYDDRLKFHPSDSEEIKKVTEQIGPGDGGGGYFDLHTGPAGGFGHRVSKETISVYLVRYGVPGERIKELMELPVWTNADAEAHFTRMGMKYSASTEQFIDLGPLARNEEMSRAEKEGMYNTCTSATKRLRLIDMDPVTGLLVHSIQEFGGTSAATSATENHCARCKKKTMRRCTKCYRKEHKPVFYCSKECQQADLPSHKAVCSQQN